MTVISVFVIKETSCRYKFTWVDKTKWLIEILLKKESSATDFENQSSCDYETATYPWNTLLGLSIENRSRYCRSSSDVWTKQPSKTKDTHHFL